MAADTGNPLANLSNEEVRILPPDYTLKKLVGHDIDLREALNSDVLEKAQAVINSHKDSFLEWVKQDLQTLELCYKEAAEHFPGCDEDIRKLARAAFVIKSQAGTFGFGLATRVAKSLDDFCTQQFRPESQHMTVVRKHIDALTAIFSKNMAGDGDAIGTALMESLMRLVEKYKN